jgi:hypothetical protein
MAAARLIKKTTQTEPNPPAASSPQPSRPRQLQTGCPQKSLSQRVGASQNSRCQDPRAAFAALFAAEA